MTHEPPTLPSIQSNTCKDEEYTAGLYVMPPMAGEVPAVEANWRETDAFVHGLRTRNVVLIEQMLSNHEPHDVLTQVPENFDWHSKTFQLAVKIERLMFNTAATREDYLNETTLRRRVQMLSRDLVQLRKRKNMMAEGFKVPV